VLIRSGKSAFPDSLISLINYLIKLQNDERVNTVGVGMEEEK